MATWIITYFGRLDLARQNQQIDLCAQRTLSIRQLWSESSLSVWNTFGSSSTQKAPAQQMLWSHWADEQADPSLRWAHMSLCLFSHTPTHNGMVHFFFHLTGRSNLWIWIFLVYNPLCTVSIITRLATRPVKWNQRTIGPVSLTWMLRIYWIRTNLEIHVNEHTMLHKLSPIQKHQEANLTQS